MHLSKAQSDTLIDLSTVPWRFQEGDNSIGADPAFEDANWDLMDADFQPDTLYPELWQGSVYSLAVISLCVATLAALHGLYRRLNL